MTIEKQQVDSNVQFLQRTVDQLKTEVKTSREQLLLLQQDKYTLEADKLSLARTIEQLQASLTELQSTRALLTLHSQIL